MSRKFILLVPLSLCMSCMSMKLDRVQKSNYIMVEPSEEPGYDYLAIIYGSEVNTGIGIWDGTKNENRTQALNWLLNGKCADNEIAVYPETKLNLKGNEIGNFKSTETFLFWAQKVKCTRGVRK